jgi:hypothetical protein
VSTLNVEPTHPIGFRGSFFKGRVAGVWSWHQPHSLNFLNKVLQSGSPLNNHPWHLEHNGDTQPSLHHHAFHVLKSHEKFTLLLLLLLFLLACSNLVDLGTVLQAGRSWAQFPIRSVDFSIDLNPLAALFPWGRLNL